MELIEITTPSCPMCQRESVVTVPAERYRAWQRGMFIQDAFPELSADERELLMTGYHPECWDEDFAGDEDGDD